MEDTRIEYVEDDNREGLIKHWESQLNDALHAVCVAQKQLDELYRQRHREIARNLGSTGLQLLIDSGQVDTSTGKRLFNANAA